MPVMAAAGISGVAGYVVLVLAARVLDPAVNASFLVFWGAVYAAFGALVGLTTETTRAVFSSGDRGSTAVFPVLIGIGGSAAALVGVSGVWWAPLLFGDAWSGLLLAMVTGIVLFSLQSGLNGAAAGTSSWTAYSLSLGSEAVMRLVLCTVAAVVGGHLVGLAWAVVLACSTWIGWVLARRDYRRFVRVRISGSRSGLARRMLVACAATGSSALLLVGYPVLLRVTTPADVFAGAAPIVLSVSLSRAPLLVPLGIYQNVLVTRVIRDGLQVLRPIVGGLGVVAAVGSAAAWWAGPWLLHVINPHYDVSGQVFAGLVLTAGLVAALTITGAATVALDRHATYLAGWLVATAVAALTLLLPGSLESRVLWSLAAGPLAGIAVHVGGGLARRS
ncbi:hypothetical protein GCM10009797_15660 [Nocardioides hwasunensis]